MGEMNLQWQLLGLVAAACIHLCGAQGEAAAICLTSDMDYIFASENVSCTECFGRGQNSSIETRLLPELEFTCDGTIVGLTVAGSLREGTMAPKLQVWRKDNSSEHEYHIQGEIPIDINSTNCEEITQLWSGAIFHCQVNETQQITVESGLDIVGVELPPLEEQSFELFFTNGSVSQIKYICYEELTQNGTVGLTLCDTVLTTDQVLLGINVNTDTSECTNICEQICTNATGLSECSCYEGYTLADDGRSCLDLNTTEACTECEHNLCSESDGSFVCLCGDGYRLGNDSRSCHDIDECAERRDHCEQSCINTEGSYRCSCKNGYSLDSDGSNCIDDNECSLGTHNCSQTCTNTEGGFRCSCNIGYSLDSDGANCNDDNECSLGTHNCSQTCINTEGGFRCSCNNGYSLDSDGVNCTDDDECSLGTHNCSQICINTEGSFRCECATGYKHDVDGEKCQEIEKPNSEQGAAAAGATIGILAAVILVTLVVVLTLFHFRRSKRMSVNLTALSPKRQVEHTISAPYLVENNGFTDGNTSPKGPRVLVLNAPTSNGDGTNLEIYNSLFDEDDTNVNIYDGTVIYNV